MLEKVLQAAVGIMALDFKLTFPTKTKVEVKKIKDKIDRCLRKPCPKWQPVKARQLVSFDRLPF